MERSNKCILELDFKNYESYEYLLVWNLPKTQYFPINPNRSVQFQKPNDDEYLKHPSLESRMPQTPVKNCSALENPLNQRKYSTEIRTQIDERH